MESTINLCLKAQVETSPPRPETLGMRAVCAMFGIAPDLSRTGHHRAPANPFHLALRPGDVVLITGPSGSGKSTWIRAFTQALAAHPSINIMSLGGAAPAETPDNTAALIDCFDTPLEHTLNLLARSGLSEARLLLRRPAELSQGEHFRYRLARFLASDADVLIADEFAAVLDRITARAAAWHLGKFIRESIHTTCPRAAIVATSHADLAADLHPTITIRAEFGRDMEITRHK